jgi:hypothetical protein
MRLSRLLLNRVLAIVLVGVGMAFASPPVASAPSAAPILPQQFGGWEMQAGAQTSHDPAAADPANAAVLKEYGFTDFAGSTYTREDGRTVKLRAARFVDASGAFGAYTFYLQPEMTREKIGDQGASLGQRVLFYRGNVLIDALFSKESPMAGAELRELAGVLPRPSGNAANLPTFLELMPQRGYVFNTQKYAMGPAALTALAPPIRADLVDFSVSPEVSLGRYKTGSGEATLMLISYPTNQLAAEHLRRIDAARRDGPAQSGIATVENTGQFFDKRTGPIIAIASGPLSDSDAKSLLGQVNYEANVTWSERTFLDKNQDLGAFLVNVIILCFILGAMAIVAGVAFGGIRILMKRLFPNKIFDRPEQMEFISLHLTETVVQGPSAGSIPGVLEAREAPPNSQ